jgi:cell division septum initiation protein DivIVA
MKWWSLEVVQELLALHLLYIASYGPVKKDLASLAAKQQEQRSKFAMDQKNREALLREKRLLEEEERKESAKFHKVLAESSLKLADCPQKMSNRPSPNTILVAVNEKIQAVEEKVGKALDEKLGSF